MKFAVQISQVLFCFALSAIAESAPAATLKSDQLIALIDGTVVPLVQSYITATNNIASFDVVIVEDTSLRKKLSEKYAGMGKWLKFESTNDIIFKTNEGGGVNLDKKTDKVVNVNRFEIIASRGNKYSVRWSRELASLSAFSKIVSMTFSNNKWVIDDIKLETVS